MRATADKLAEECNSTIGAAFCPSTSEVIVVAATGSREWAQAKKDMAERARRLALTQVNDEDRQRLLQWAMELDAEAEAFERGETPVVLRTEAVTQPQQQVQQQQAHEPGKPPTLKE